MDNGLSSVAIALAVGLVFGMLAGAPATLLILATSRRRTARTAPPLPSVSAVTVRRMTTGSNDVVLAEQHILPPEVAALLADDDWLDAEPVHLDRYGNVRKFEVRWSE